METFVVASVTAIVFFVLGVIFHKYVVSEAEAVKDHVTETVSSLEGRIRADVATVLSRLSRS